MSHLDDAAADMVGKRSTVDEHTTELIDSGVAIVDGERRTSEGRSERGTDEGSRRQV